MSRLLYFCCFVCQVCCDVVHLPCRCLFLTRNSSTQNAAMTVPSIVEKKETANKSGRRTIFHCIMFLIILYVMTVLLFSTPLSLSKRTLQAFFFFFFSREAFFVHRKQRSLFPPPALHVIHFKKENLPRRREVNVDCGAFVPRRK